MFSLQGLGRSFWVLGALAALVPGVAASQDRDTQEVQRYVLTAAALAKYRQATTSLAALPADSCDEDDGGGDGQTIAQSVARLDAMPRAKAAIQSAGMTTREYVVFSWSLLHNGLAAWALKEPGGKLPPGTSKANVDFYNQHAAELESLPEPGEGDCDEAPAEDDYTE